MNKILLQSKHWLRYITRLISTKNRVDVAIKFSPTTLCFIDNNINVANMVCSSNLQIFQNSSSAYQSTSIAGQTASTDNHLGDWTELVILLTLITAVLLYEPVMALLTQLNSKSNVDPMPIPPTPVMNRREIPEIEIGMSESPENGRILDIKPLGCRKQVIKYYVESSPTTDWQSSNCNLDLNDSEISEENENNEKLKFLTKHCDMNNNNSNKASIQVEFYRSCLQSPVKNNISMIENKSIQMTEIYDLENESIATIEFQRISRSNISTTTATSSGSINIRKSIDDDNLTIEEFIDHLQEFLNGNNKNNISNDNVNINNIISDNSSSTTTITAKNNALFNNNIINCENKNENILKISNNENHEMKMKSFEIDEVTSIASGQTDMEVTSLTSLNDISAITPLREDNDYYYNFNGNNNNNCSSYNYYNNMQFMVTPYTDHKKDSSNNNNYHKIYNHKNNNNNNIINNNSKNNINNNNNNNSCNYDLLHLRESTWNNCGNILMSAIKQQKQCETNKTDNINNNIIINDNSNSNSININENRLSLLPSPNYTLLKRLSRKSFKVSNKIETENENENEKQSSSINNNNNNNNVNNNEIEELLLLSMQSTDDSSFDEFHSIRF